MIAELQKHSLIAFNIYADVRSAVSSLVTGFSFACSGELSADAHIHFQAAALLQKPFMFR